jgi:hypothetical protein
MGRRFYAKGPGYNRRDVEFSSVPLVGPRPGRRAESLHHLTAVEQLQALAAASTVPVRRIETGKRTVSDKQAFLALHGTDSYRYDMRHFVGDLQARLGMRHRQPIEPRADDVELTPEEAEAERGVKLRRYWARRPRGQP